ncbi:MAG: hypothetical protein VR68_04230 [Peptococcaceae bacterium BRH_c4a]|nr:MAG: hypothetical protein VR68_04230 [Peptococcaceae bacterium BRH_c4a]
MNTVLAATDLQSFSLAMIVGNILDPLTPGVIRRISGNILNQVCQPIIITDQKGKIALINSAFAKMTRLSVSDDAYDQFGFNELNFMDPNINKILDFGISVTDLRDSIFIKGDMKKIPAKISIFPVFGNNQLRLGSVCTVIDITSDVNYHALLQKSETILNAINIGVITLDQDLTITLINKNAEYSFNVGKKPFLGRPFRCLAEHLAGDWSYIVRSLEGNIEIKDYELVVGAKENQYYIINTHLLRNDLNEAYGTIVVFKNITHIKQIEMQLIRSEKLKVIGELAAGTAHEMRNPLTTVRGFVQIIKDKIMKMGINEFDSQMQMILSEIDRVNKIISDFLNLSKPHNRKRESLRLNDILNNVMFLLENEALRRRINIRKILDETIPPVNGDNDELEQVFLNIVNNAFQAMSVHGDFTIKTYMSTDRSNVIIDFIDTGDGIPEELLPKIFDPFFSTKNEGIGLGLAISNRIINDHCGELKVASKKGGGTTITILLPCGKN